MPAIKFTAEIKYFKFDFTSLWILKLKFCKFCLILRTTSTNILCWLCTYYLLVWPDLSIFLSLGKDFGGSFNFEPTLAKFFAFWANFQWRKWPNYWKIVSASGHTGTVRVENYHYRNYTSVANFVAASWRAKTNLYSLLLRHYT